MPSIREQIIRGFLAEQWGIAEQPTSAEISDIHVTEIADAVAGVPANANREVRIIEEADTITYTGIEPVPTPVPVQVPRKRKTATARKSDWDSGFNDTLKFILEKQRALFNLRGNVVMCDCCGGNAVPIPKLLSLFSAPMLCPNCAQQYMQNRSYHAPEESDERTSFSIFYPTIQTSEVTELAKLPLSEFLEATAKIPLIKNILRRAKWMKVDVTNELPYLFRIGQLFYSPGMPLPDDVVMVVSSQQNGRYYSMLHFLHSMALFGGAGHVYRGSYTSVPIDNMRAEAFAYQYTNATDGNRMKLLKQFAVENVRMSYEPLFSGTLRHAPVSGTIRSFASRPNFLSLLCLAFLYPSLRGRTVLPHANAQDIQRMIRTGEYPYHEIPTSSVTCDITNIPVSKVESFTIAMQELAIFVRNMPPTKAGALSVLDTAKEIYKDVQTDTTLIETLGGVLSA